MQILQTIWTALTTESEGLVNLTGIPFCFIEVYIFMLLFTTFFNLKIENKVSSILYVVLFSLLTILSRSLIPDPYGTFINIIICPILIIIFFKTSILKAIFSELFPMLICAMIDSILYKFFNFFLHVTNTDILSIPIYRILFSTIEYTFMYFTFLILKKFNINIGALNIKTNHQKALLTLTAILGTISIALQMYISAYYLHVLPLYILIISITCLIAYFSISLYSLINTSKLNIARQNLEETKLMNKTLTSLNDKIRAFRHDFNNIIQALGGYIQAKDIDGLEKYYSQLLKDCQEVNNLTGLNPEAINNPAIYSLLASKYYLATEKGIEFDLDIFMDLTSIDMKIYEFCRILGILLDNAIQATQECEEKHIKVTIRKDNRCKRQLLIVENTYKEKDIDTEKIFEKGYSTKEGNTGLGLWEVRQILLKNTNLNLFTSKDNTYFKQQLEIYKS